MGQWMNSSTIHDNIHSLTPKKCHPKSYRSDIKYYMTLNIIFSVSCHELEFMYYASLTIRTFVPTMSIEGEDFRTPLMFKNIHQFDPIISMMDLIC